MKKIYLVQMEKSNVEPSINNKYSHKFVITF